MNFSALTEKSIIMLGFSNLVTDVMTLLQFDIPQMMQADKDH